MTKPSLAELTSELTSNVRQLATVIKSLRTNDFTVADRAELSSLLDDLKAYAVLPADSPWPNGEQLGRQP